MDVDTQKEQESLNMNIFAQYRIAVLLLGYNEAAKSEAAGVFDAKIAGCWQYRNQ